MGKIDFLSKIRSANKKALLRQIRQSGSISRVQLAQILRLGKSTVTENINPLLQCGIVQEIGTGSANMSGGRRPVLLRINGSYRYMVLAELGLREPIFALADLNGRVLIRKTLIVPEDAPYAVRLRMVKEIIRQLLRDGNISQQILAVIALSSPGAYNAREKRFILNPEFANWDTGRLTQDLESSFCTKVFRVNDVNAATIGELHQGAGKGLRNMVYISCGVGVGLGIALEGSLYTGTSGSAGEIARIKFPSPLPAGGQERLRAIVEFNALEMRIREGISDKTLAEACLTRDRLDFPSILELWKKGEPFVRQCVAEAAELLGDVAAFCVSIFNVELVVFGGEYLAFEEQVLPILNQKVNLGAFDPVPVIPSSLRQEAGLQGLISMAAEYLLDSIAQE